MRDEGLIDREVAVGIETHGQLVGVVIQIAFHSEAPAVQRILALLGSAVESVRQFRGAPICQMRDLAGKPEPIVGAIAVRGIVVIAGAEFRVQ